MNPLTSVLVGYVTLAFGQVPGQTPHMEQEVQENVVESMDPRAMKVPGRAKIQLHVPPDAKVWIGNQEMRTGGALRQFVSPTLQAGMKYAYPLTVEWPGGPDGKFRIRQEITVRANETSQIDLRPLATEVGKPSTNPAPTGRVRPASHRLRAQPFRQSSPYGDPFPTVAPRR